MGRFVRGEVVVVPFPFSDLSATKRRPALVIASPAGDDQIVCAITSQHYASRFALTLDAEGFQSGGLTRPSSIRVDKLFTRHALSVDG